MRGLYFVAPDEREQDVRRQLARPAFRRIAEPAVKYLPYSALERNREQSRAARTEGVTGMVTP